MQRKYTIITVTYNNAQGLRKTLESIKRLRYRAFELIIVDGKSKDDTEKVVKEYEEVVTKFVSEKDKGIYDAMNKGLALATGDYIVFMNAGDMFASEDTLDVVNRLDGELILGSALYGSDVRILPKRMTLYDVISIGINHQSVYYRTDLLREYPFDMAYPIIADMKTVVEPMAKRCIVPVCTEEVLSVCEGGGLSQHRWRDIKTERDRMVEEVVAPFYKADYMRLTRIDNGMIGDFAVLSQFRMLFPLLRMITKFARVYNRLFKKIPL